MERRREERRAEESRGATLRQPLSLPLIVTSRIFIHASVPNKKTLEVILSPSLSHSLTLSNLCMLGASYAKKDGCPLKQNKVNKILPLFATAFHIFHFEGECMLVLIEK